MFGELNISSNGDCGVLSFLYSNWIATIRATIRASVWATAL